MITITLTGKEALEYIAKQESPEQPTVVKLAPDMTTPFDEPETADVNAADERWRKHLGSDELPEPNSRRHVRFDKEEREVIANAANRSNPMLYSVTALSKGTGRSEAAIASEAYSQGFVVRKGLILSKES